MPKFSSGVAKAFGDLGVADKVYGIVGLFVVLTLLLMTMAIQSVRLQAEYREDLATSANAALNVERAKGLIFAIVMESRGIYMSAEPAKAKPFGDALLVRNRELGQVVAQWQASVRPDDAAQFANFKKRIDQFIEFRRELVRRAVEVSPASGREWGDNDANRSLRTALSEDLAVLAEIYAERAKAVVDLGNLTRLAAWYLALLGFGTLLLACLSVVVMRRFVIAPLSDITAATDQIAAGKIELDVPHLQRRDEIGRLAAAVQNFRNAAIRNQELEVLESGTAKQRDVALQQRDALNDKYYATKWQLSAAINNMPQGLLMLNSAADILVINDQYRKMYGLPVDIKSGSSLEQVLKCRVSSGLFSGSISKYLAQIVARIATRQPTVSEIELNDGRVVRISEQPMAGGGWLSIHDDFTDQRHARRILERTEILLVTVIENIPEAIVAKDAHNLRYIFFNRAAERLFGVPRAEMIGKTARELFPAESAAIIERHDRELISGNQEMELASHLIETPKNGKRRVAVRRMPVMVPDGGSSILLSMIQDQTEIAQLPT